MLEALHFSQILLLLELELRPVVHMVRSLRPRILDRRVLLVHLELLLFYLLVLVELSNGVFVHEFVQVVELAHVYPRSQPGVDPCLGFLSVLRVLLLEH